MSSQNLHKKRSYSFIYILYRRLRYVRFKKKLIKRRNLEIKKIRIIEQNENLLHLQDYKLTERYNRRIKLKAEREESNKRKRELKEEFRHRKKLEKQEWQKLSAEEKIRTKKARAREKKNKRRLYRHYIRIIFRNFFLSFRSINIRSIKRKITEFRENAPKRKRFLLISFNSTVLFLLSYFTFFIVSQAITVIAASFFDYPTIVYYYEIFFNISPEAWFHESVKTIFASGPLVNFVIGITFLIIYNNIKESTGPFKLFFLWGFLHAVNMLFGALLVGTLFEAGVGHVISWMYIMDTGKVLYSIISIFLLVIAGLLSTRQFLISANTYYNEMNKSNRTSFIIGQVLIPFLAGNAFLVLIRQPRFIFYDTFTGIALIMCIIPVLLTYRSYNELYFEEDEKSPGLVWISLIALAAVAFFFRGVLEAGLRFGG